ncbi:MAG: sensor domain-containing diguanylate cyclase [Agarilytica sp.]
MADIIDPNLLAAASLENTLLRSICKTIELDELLNTLYCEIERLNVFDGFLINLVDINQENLICEKARLPKGFESFETTLKKYKFPLDSDYVNAEAYKKNEVVSFDTDSLEKYDDTVKQRFKLWQIEQMLVVPIPEPDTDNSLGTVMVFRQGKRIDHTTTVKLSNLVDIFCYQIKNSRLYDGMRERQSQVEQTAAEQQRFLEFIAEINNLTSTDEIYKTISLEFLQQLPFDIASVSMQEGGHLVSKHNTVINSYFDETLKRWKEHIENLEYGLDHTEGAVPAVYVNNTHLLFPDVMAIQHLPMPVNDKRGLDTLETPRTFLLMPIRYKGEPIGVISLLSVSKTIKVSDEEIKLVELLCNFIGTAIKNAEVYDLVAQQKSEIEILNHSLQDKVYELGELASKDKLTGLYNFRSFESELDRRIEEYHLKSNEFELALIILDIDNFKDFNDAHGHAAGNTVLAGVAHKISDLARKKDIACRYGGEEFVVILPKCDLTGAQVFADRVRKTIERSSFTTDVGELGVTVSIGFGCHSRKETREELFERVDQALYRAKHRGRNRIEVAP